MKLKLVIAASLFSISLLNAQSPAEHAEQSKSVAKMSYSSANLEQIQLPTGRGNLNQHILAVKVVTSGTSNALKLTAINYTMTGTTNRSDVTRIKIYYTGTNSTFNTSKLFGVVTLPKSGTITCTGTQTLAAGTNYFWISYDVNASAVEGNFLDATCESVKIGSTTKNLTTRAVTGARTILLTNTQLFAPGDGGASCYRIPAMITAADGSLVTVTDKRWNGSGDLAAKIDPVVRRSTDNGTTWSAPLTIANFGAATGVGDAALVMDKTTGNLLCIMAAKVGFFASTPSNAIRMVYCRSKDNGITWAAPIDITDQIYGSGCSNPVTKNWQAVFAASGNAHQLRDGKIVAAIAVREVSGGPIVNHMIASADGGITWIPYTGVAATNGDESKIVELNNGNLMMSIRHAGSRWFTTSSDKGVSWSTPYTQTSITDPGCNGDFIRYTSTLDGYNKNRLLHSIPFATSRSNVSVLLSTDEGATWSYRKTIFSGASAYSSLAILSDGTIGIYYENGDNGAIYNMYFASFSLNWLTNGADTYTPVTPTATSIELSDETDSRYHVYPNPAQQLIQIQFATSSVPEIKIVNSTGQMILFSKTISDGQISIDASSMNNGLYFIIIKEGAHVLTKKIIIDK